MSDPIKVVCFGARHIGGQVVRIEEGLIQCGAWVATGYCPDPDLIYANDSDRWPEAIALHEKVPSSKLILNVLDVPEHTTGFNPSTIYLLLQRASAITTISRYVQGQLIRYFCLSSKVIYNPIKPVTADKRQRGERPYPQYRAMMVGRLRDPEKRADLARQGLAMAGFRSEEVAIVGESIGWGTYLGEVNDEILNDLYNSVDFVLMASRFEGLGLVGCEAFAAGAIPVTCCDLTTFHEWYPAHYNCFPNPASIAYRLISLVNNPPFLAAEKALVLEHGAEIRETLSGAAVARRILDIYNELIKPSIS